MANSAAGHARLAAPAPGIGWRLLHEWIAAVRFLRQGRLQTAFIVGGISMI